MAEYRFVDGHQNAVWFFVLCCVWFSLTTTAMAQVRDQRPRVLSGFSESEAFSIKDDLPIDPTGPTVLKLLYRAKKTSPATRNDYCRFSQSVTWDQVSTDTAQYRFWMFRRRFRLHRVEKVLVPNAVDSSEIEQVYRCIGVVVGEGWKGDDDDSNTATIPCEVLTRRIPKNLITNQRLDEPVEFQGFLFGRIIDENPQPNQLSAERWLFVADRLSWYPDSTKFAGGAKAVLGKLGFNVGLLDDIVANSNKGLMTSDNEAFFSLLGAVSKAEGSQSFGKQAADRVGLTDLLKKPTENLGELVQFTGTCRTCTRMPVPYEDIQKRLGISEYYQLVVFPKLNGRVKMNEQGKEITLDRYPVTICCAKLPAGTTPESIARKSVSIDGVYFRMWKFRTEATDRVGISGTTSPLIMANSPKVLVTSTAEVNRYVLYFVLLIILAIGFGLAYLRLTDMRTEKKSILETLPEKIDVAGLDD